MGISSDNLDVAMAAMEGDSQAGTPLARDAAMGKPWLRDERAVKVCEQLLKKYDLPPFDCKFRYLQSSDIEITS